jgi:hypothetical protein
VGTLRPLEMAKNKNDESKIIIEITSHCCACKLRMNKNFGKN